MCRTLHALAHGTIVSKPAAARWAMDALGGQWTALIERALAWRPDTPPGSAFTTEHPLPNTSGAGGRAGTTERSPAGMDAPRRPPEALDETVDFMRYTLERSRPFQRPAPSDAA
jgi:hypothetical protein